jgi:hypothetical protein
MSTDAQINANRLNAQKSTGPRSPEGKSASRLNALKSGIDARSQILPGEDPEELEALTASFVAHFHPTDPNQQSLVDALIDAEWTQRRLRLIEAQLWTTYSFADAFDPFIRIQRRIDSTNRLYLRTLKALQDLQAAQPLTPEIGFVPQIANSGTGFEIPHSVLPSFHEGPSAESSLPVPELAALTPAPRSNTP